MLHALRHAVDLGRDTGSLVEQIEEFILDDPAGSRATILAHDGGEMMRVWALGHVGDPADFDRISASLADPEGRSNALEALGSQPDAARVDAVARSFLDDSDPGVRSRAAGMVAFCQRPGALAALLPLASDPVAQVRMNLGWYLGGLHDLAAEPVLQALLVDPDEQVRTFAARGLTRLRKPLPWAAFAAE